MKLKRTQMNNEPDHNNPKRSALEDILQHFEEDKRDQIKKIWDQTGQIDSGFTNEITVEETEQALTDVHNRLDVQKPASTAGASSITVKWKWLMAAVILLIAGAGYLLLPKTVTVPYGYISSVELPDGSQIELNSGTQIRYNRLMSLTNRTVHLNGEAYFNVTHHELPFTVHTNGSAVRVTGTEFNIRSWHSDPDTETKVTVTEGEVLFYPVNNPERQVTVTPDRISRWTMEMETPSRPEPVDVSRILGWREQILVFDDQPLPAIFRELERRFDVQIELGDIRMLRETLTAYYVKPGNIESVLNDICIVKGLRYTETANGYRIYRRGDR